MTDQPSKVVPVEPTDEMMQAAYDAGGRNNFRDVWAAMIAAAPHEEAQTPAPQGGGEAHAPADLLERARRQINLGKQTGADGGGSSPSNIYVIAAGLLAALKPQTPDVLGEALPWNEIEVGRALARWVIQDHEALGLHPRTARLVRTFAGALGHKLRAAEIKYGHADEWATEDWEARCQADLMAHVLKGDPLDVAAYAAFCWDRKWRTAPNATPPGDVLGGEGQAGVWVLTASQGEYSDRHEWTVEVYSSEVDGRAAVERLDAEDREKGKGDRYHEETTHYLSGPYPILAARPSQSDEGGKP